MTQKELSYAEDAVNHEEVIISLLSDMKESLQEEELKSFVDGEIETHTSMKDSLMNLLEVNVNE